MSKKHIKVIGWDTWAFTEYFNGQFSNTEFKNKPIFEHILDEITNKKVVIVSSILVKAEVLMYKYNSPDQKDTILKFFHRPEIQFIPVTEPIVEETEKIRSHLKLSHGINLQCADAVHLATAILYNAKYFHTGDERLLKCNNRIPWSKTIICEPFIEQKTLLDLTE